MDSKRAFLGLALAFVFSTGLIDTARSDSAANPALFARVDGVEDESTRRALPIDKLEIDTVILGNIAQTTLLATFANESDEELEGEFSLALPQGAVVTGYALDVDDVMIDGVLVEPLKARAEYEDKVREGIDPGVAEVSRANVFTTRVYPILSGAGRTIRLTFVAPVHSRDGWVLPLATEETVTELSIALRAADIREFPAVKLPAAKLDAVWRKQRNAFVTAVKASDVQLSGEFRLSAVRPLQPLLVATHPNGRRFFQLSDSIVAARHELPAPDRVRIYWDRSLSRRNDALVEEIDLLSRYLASTKPATVDVVVFNSSSADVESFSAMDAVSQLLHRITYRGATSFAVLESLDLPRADICLVFSDGAATIDRRDEFRPDCDLAAITSAADADRGYLQNLAREVNGSVWELGVHSSDEILAELLSPTPRIIDVRDRDGGALSFVATDGAAGDLNAVGEAPIAGDVIVYVATGRRVIERRYSTNRARSGLFEGPGALWAANRVAALAAEDAKTDEVRRVSRLYSVASPMMSFVVLEAPEDYVAAGLAPPKNYPEWETYLEDKIIRDEELAEQRANRLDEVIERWENQKQWWATDFTETSSGGSHLMSPAIRSYGGIGIGGDGDLSEIMVTATRREPAAPGGIARIGLEPWQSDRPYIKKLDESTPVSFASVLAEQEKAHGALPAFYLDVAEWLHRRDRNEEALEMLLSALELPSRNTETLLVVADRLLRYGRFDRAIWMHERILELEPQRPQPRRALALALAKRAGAKSGMQAKRDLLRAVDLLRGVVMEPWDEAYDGIDLIALMEMNALIPKLRRLGKTYAKLDPRLIAPLDVDLRVVIEWNTAATDLDLSVDEPEPDGEQAYYGNPLTSIGGRLTNDMTWGYGPEEYLLRRALDGSYEISVDVYSRDRINPNGATTVTAHLTHDFGRDSEWTESIDLELLPRGDDEDDDDGDDKKLIGRVMIERNNDAT